MITLEQVEKLRERANVTFAEAKEALEQSGGDLLDALILLESQGKTAPPPSGGYYSGENRSDAEQQPCDQDSSGYKQHMSFGDIMRSLGSLILRALNIGNINYIDAYRNGHVVLSCPVTVFVVLLILGFWVTIPLLFIGLICGWRYKLRGPDLGRDDINEVIENAENMVDDFKNSVVESAQAAKAEHEAQKAEYGTEE